MRYKTMLIAVGILLSPGSIFARYQDEHVISPDQAKAHIGEKKEVQGYVFKAELRMISKRKHTALVLFYLSGADHSKPAFIDIIKGRVDEESGIMRTSNGRMSMNVKNLLHQQNILVSTGAHTDLEAAEGRIIVFEGLPAIRTDFENKIILEPVD